MPSHAALVLLAVIAASLVGTASAGRWFVPKAPVRRCPAALSQLSAVYQNQPSGCTLVDTELKNFRAAQSLWRSTQEMKDEFRTIPPAQRLAFTSRVWTILDPAGDGSSQSGPQSCFPHGTLSAVKLSPNILASMSEFSRSLSTCAQQPTPDEVRQTIYGGILSNLGALNPNELKDHLDAVENEDWLYFAWLHPTLLKWKKWATEHENAAGSMAIFDLCEKFLVYTVPAAKRLGEGELGKGAGVALLYAKHVEAQDTPGDFLSAMMACTTSNWGERLAAALKTQHPIFKLYTSPGESLALVEQGLLERGEEPNITVLNKSAEFEVAMWTLGKKFEVLAQNSDSEESSGDSEEEEEELVGEEEEEGRVEPMEQDSEWVVDEDSDYEDE